MDVMDSVLRLVSLFGENGRDNTSIDEHQTFLDIFYKSPPAL